jgi:RHS repeat-associated protein
MCEVEPSFGSVCLQEEDFSLNGDRTFSFSRRYNNLSDYSGPLGLGWTHLFDVHLLEEKEGLVLIDEEGRRISLNRLTRGHSIKYPAEGFILEHANNAYVIHAKEGRRLTFAQTPDGRNRLALMQLDQTGSDTIWLLYNSGLLREIRNSSGHVLIISYNKDKRIERILIKIKEGEMIPLASYQYDKNGQLTHAYNIEGRPAVYEYSRGLMTRCTNRLGGSYYLDYDEKGRCINLWQDGYNSYRKFQYDDKKQMTLVTDSLGQSTLYRYDEYYLLAETVRFDGSKIQHVYADGNQPLAVIGEETPAPGTSRYDELQNVVESVGPSGEVSKWKYDDRGRVIEEVDANGGISTWDYDDSNHVIREVNPLGGVTLFEYNPEGVVVSETLPLGNKVSLMRTADGLRLKDRLGLLYYSEQDRFGNTTSITRATSRKTSFRYDNFGRITAVISNTGDLAENRYDAEGYLIRATSFTGSESHYERDAFGLLLRWIKPSGKIIDYQYDSERRLTAAQTSTGAECRFAYDSRGRLIQQSLVDGRVETFAYDEQGNISSVVDSGGMQAHYKFTASGFISEIIYDRSRASYEYDAMGNCCSATADDHPVERLFGPEDVLLCEMQGDFKVEYEYNSIGQIVLRKDSNGRIAKYDYNVRAELISIEDTVFGTHRFEYDDFERESCHTLPNGIRKRYYYDKADDISDVVTTGPDGTVLKRRRYLYTPTVEMARAETVDEEAANFEYDLEYHLLRVTGNAGEEEFRYDLDENIVYNSEYGHFKYDGVYLRSAGPLRYEYDGAGRVISRTSGETTFRYSYGIGGLISEVILPDGSVYRYEYDGFGRRVIKSGSGITIHYYWDQDFLLAERRTNESGSIMIDYAFFPHSFRPLGHAVEGQSFYYDLDQQALVREIYDQSGKEVAKFRYSAFGKRTISKLLSTQADSPLRFLGQIEDYETGLYNNRFRYYDPQIGRFLSPDLYMHEVDNNAYAYARNPINWADPFGLNDFKASDKNAWKEENKQKNAGFYTCEHCNFQTKNKVFAIAPKSGRPVGDGSIHMDHKNTPNANGGAATKPNSQTLGGTCNCSKGKRKKVGMT